MSCPSASPARACTAPTHPCNPPCSGTRSAGSARPDGTKSRSAAGSRGLRGRGRAGIGPRVAAEGPRGSPRCTCVEGQGSCVVSAPPAARPGAAPAHLSQWSPPVWSRQPRHAPVWVSHSSACPLHTHGRQLGNPHWPCWQRSQRSPKAPARQGHCPLAPSHRPLSDPSGLHWQAGGKAGLSPRGRGVWAGPGGGGGCRGLRRKGEGEGEPARGLNLGLGRGREVP